MSNFKFNSVNENIGRNNFTNVPYNVNMTHPLIPNSQDYMIYKKYVSIHSEDRDIIKYPNSSEFEIELPEDIINVSSIRLVQWTFPVNYNTFSVNNNNLYFTFKITNPYNPSINGVSDVFAYRVFEALFSTMDKRYEFLIEEGFYNPVQMATELTNKFNHVVTLRIQSYFISKNWTDSLEQLSLEGGYTRFVIVYNEVNAKIWFGNRADGFLLINEAGVASNILNEALCNLKSLPNSSNYGLPSFLGLRRLNSEAISGSTLNNGMQVPRFFYGDVSPGDNGYWLLPYTGFSGSEVYWIECPFKINLMGESYFYMELAGQNCIDETKPYNVSEFTLTTNQTNGVVNSSFAKIAVPSTPMSQIYDREQSPYKFYYPPLERIRRLKLKLRYHDGSPLIFGVFNYTFLLEFSIMLPMIPRDTRLVPNAP